MKILERFLNNDKLTLTPFLLITVASTSLFSARRIAYYDFNFITNAVHRMALGQLPYRDFDLVLPPVTFLPVYVFHHFLSLPLGSAMYLSAVLTQVLALVAFYSILNSILRNRASGFEKSIFLISMLFASLVNVIAIYPNYIYDSVATMLALTSLAFFLKYLDSNKYQYFLCSIIFSILSFFTKFNMGGSLILGICIVLGFEFAKNHSYKKTAKEAIGIAGLLGLATSLIAIFGLHTFIEQTIIAPGKFKGVATFGQLAPYNQPLLILVMVAILTSLKFRSIQNLVTKCTLTIIGVGLGLCLLHNLTANESADAFFDKVYPNANFTFPMFMLLALQILIYRRTSYKNYESALLTIIPIYFFGTFLSQGWDGSSYSLNPMLILLLAVIYSSLGLTEQSKLRAIVLATFILIGLNFLVTASNGGRLEYVADAGMRSQPFNWNSIGVATSRQDIDQAIEVKNFIEAANSGGYIVEFPAEDSLQDFSSILIPWNRCLQFTFICPSKSNQSLIEDFAADTPAVTIIKKNSQIHRDIESIVPVMELILQTCLREVFSNATYIVYGQTKYSKECLKELLRIKSE